MNSTENIIESAGAPKCPHCGALAEYLGDVDWIFRFKTCFKCGRNYLARKTKKNANYESKLSTFYRDWSKRIDQAIVDGTDCSFGTGMKIPKYKAPIGEKSDES